MENKRKYISIKATEYDDSYNLSFIIAYPTIIIKYGKRFYNFNNLERTCNKLIAYINDVERGSVKEKIDLLDACCC